MSPKEIMERFTGITALVVGDVMLDAYLWGRVDRISPEAPVPVVQVSRRSARLGGAANVALNLNALGATAIVASIIGEDPHAEDLEKLFAEHGLNTQGILRSPKRRTTLKTRIIRGDRHVVRVEEEMGSELQEAEARGNKLLEQSRHQATELTNAARAEVDQTLEWARTQAHSVIARAQQGAEQLLAAAGLGPEAIGEVSAAIVAAANAAAEASRAQRGTASDLPAPPRIAAAPEPEAETEPEADVEQQPEPEAADDAPEPGDDAS